MDEKFIKKVYRSSVIAWSIAMIWAFGLGKPWIALSITLGTIVSLGIIASFDVVVRKVFVPGSDKSKKALLKLALIKYPIFGVVIYLVVQWDKIDILAFCGGFVLVHVAMLAKLAGIRLMENLKTDKTSSSDH